MLICEPTSPLSQFSMLDKFPLTLMECMRVDLINIKLHSNWSINLTGNVTPQHMFSSFLKLRYLCNFLSIMLQFGSLVFHYGLCVEGNCVLVHNLWHCRKVVSSLRVLWKEVRLLVACSWRGYWDPPPPFCFSLLLDSHKISIFVPRSSLQWRCAAS